MVDVSIRWVDEKINYLLEKSHSVIFHSLIIPLEVSEFKQTLHHHYNKNNSLRFAHSFGIHSVGAPPQLVGVAANSSSPNVSNSTPTPRIPLRTHMVAPPRALCRCIRNLTLFTWSPYVRTWLLALFYLYVLQMHGAYADKSSLFVFV